MCNVCTWLGRCLCNLTVSFLGFYIFLRLPYCHPLIEAYSQSVNLAPLTDGIDGGWKITPPKVYKTG